MKELAIVCKFLKVFRDSVIEFSCLPDENLLHREEIPVLSNWLKKVVEKVIEFKAKVVPNEDNVVAQLYLVLSDTMRNLITNLELSVAYFP
jgi:hypothetical protein